MFKWIMDKIGIHSKEEMAFAMIAGGGLAMMAVIYRLIFTPATLTSEEKEFMVLVLLTAAAVWWKVGKDNG